MKEMMKQRKDTTIRTADMALEAETLRTTRSARWGGGDFLLRGGLILYHLGPSKPNDVL
jgi:hypothetical protein